MQSPPRRPTVSAPVDDPLGPSALLVTALAFGVAGFSFGAYFYAVPFHRKAAQLEKVTRELAAKNQGNGHRGVDVQGQDAAARTLSQMKSLQGQIDEQLAGVGAKVTLGPHRMLVRFPEDKLFESRGPWLSKPGQEAMQTLGALLARRVHRVVIAAPMGNGTVPRWVRAQLPTPADLSAARAGSALKAVVKGGIGAETVLAVIGSLSTDDANAAPTLDFELEP
jgi:hypothetical protein